MYYYSLVWTALDLQGGGQNSLHHNSSDKLVYLDYFLSEYNIHLLLVSQKAKLGSNHVGRYK